MSKFKRLNLAESEWYFPLLNEDARKTLKGGCEGCSEWIITYPGLPIYTEDEYTRLDNAGEWTGGLVCGFGYMLPSAVVYGNMGYCGRHEEYYQDGLCYSCYLNDNYCSFHQTYFCYDRNQPGGTMGGGESGGEGNTGGGDSGSDGGGGSTVIVPPGGGSAGYDNSSGSFDFQSVVNENVGNSFQEADKLVLINILKQITGNEVGRLILELIANKDCWMKFEIGDTKINTDPSSGNTWWAPAIYNKVTDTITFKSSDDIGYVNFSEELAHAVQRSIYGDEMTAANPNYEFEAKIIRDVIQGSAAEQMNFGDNDSKLNYSFLVEAVKSGELSVDGLMEKYQKSYYEWKDPSGAKQELTPDSPYYCEDAEDNSYDPQLLKLVLENCIKNKK